MSVEKVISGGQIGADIAALRAARQLGIPTGGYAPKGWRTLSGPRPELGTVYGLVDCGGGYGLRTDMNVAYADATLRLAANFASPGEKRTLKAIYRYKRPHKDIPLARFRDEDDQEPYWQVCAASGNVRAWLREHDVKVLNVAGNARAEMEGPVEEFLLAVLGEARR